MNIYAPVFYIQTMDTIRHSCLSRKSSHINNTRIYYQTSFGTEAGQNG